MNKWKVLLLAIIMCLAFPVSSFASTGISMGAGEWDWAGSRIFYGDHRDNPVSSGGGDFWIQYVQYPNYPSTTFKVYEYDPNNADDYVGTYTVTASNRDVYLRGISNFVDGSNNKAEFYVKTSNDNDVSNVAFWD